VLLTHAKRVRAIQLRYSRNRQWLRLLTQSQIHIGNGDPGTIIAFPSEMFGLIVIA